MNKETKTMENWNACTCGKHLLQGDDLIDTVYPCNQIKTVYNAYCNVSMGGCGRTVYADNISTLLKRWNIGSTDENSEQPIFTCLQCVIDAIEVFNINKQINSDLVHFMPLRVYFNEADNNICKHKNKSIQCAKLYDMVQLLSSSQYATDAFQQEGFGHLKLDDFGTIIKLYDDGTYLVQFIDEEVEQSNIYSKNDLKLI